MHYSNEFHVPKDCDDSDDSLSDTDNDSTLVDNAIPLSDVDLDDTITWKRIVAVKGRPGTSKTQVILASIDYCIY